MVQRALQRAYARFGAAYLPRALFPQLQLIYPGDRHRPWRACCPSGCYDNDVVLAHGDAGA